MGNVPEMTFTKNVEKFCQPGLRRIEADDAGITRLAVQLDEAFEAIDELELGPKGPVHSDVNLTQFVQRGDQVTLLDYDGLCYSHAALDVANFAVTLEVKVADGQAKAAAFVEAYQACIDRTLPGWTVYKALAFARRAVRSVRNREGDNWQKNAHNLIERALKCLAENP